MRGWAVRATWALTLLLAGCAEWTAPAAPTQPFFTLDPADAKSFQALAKKLDGLTSKCTESTSCDHVYFARALLGLYESREAAEKFFGKVLAVAPKSHLAHSSKAWLQLLQDHPPPRSTPWPQAFLTAPSLAGTNESLGQTVDRLVRDLLDRELVIQQLRQTQEGEFQTVESLQRELADRERKIETLLGKREAGKNATDQNTVHALQKQLADRDKKIEELSTQLEALKRIDQEMREKVRPIRPPSTSGTVPSPESPQ